MKQHQILRSPDASVSGGAQEVDPLSGAAAGWEAPKYPVIPEGRLVRMECVSCVYGPTKDTAELPDNEKRYSLTHVWKTTKDYVDREGKPLHAGYKITMRDPMTPSATPGKRELTWKDIGARVSMMIKACGKEFANKTEPKNLRDTPELLVGQIADCKTTINKASGDFPESNGLKFIPAEN